MNNILHRVGCRDVFGLCVQLIVVAGVYPRCPFAGFGFVYFPTVRHFRGSFCLGLADPAVRFRGFVVRMRRLVRLRSLSVRLRLHLLP